MKSSELNYLKIGFSKISFEGKEKKRVDFENGPRMVAMQWGHACGPGVQLYLLYHPQNWLGDLSLN